ncbi:MAG: hypothetical protein EOO73_29000 [Myxococcales bacterium]|nr:MAG: hypothetical protein EOO73_29000 [Myxococcales bacterium]
MWLARACPSHRDSPRKSRRQKPLAPGQKRRLRRPRSTERRDQTPPKTSQAPALSPRPPRPRPPRPRPPRPRPPRLQLRPNPPLRLRPQAPRRTTSSSSKARRRSKRHRAR